MQSGCSVRGGQMQSPVTGSHSREPQLHAGGTGSRVKGQGSWLILAIAPLLLLSSSFLGLLYNYCLNAVKNDRDIGHNR